MRASNIRSASWNAKDTMDCASGTCTETFLFFGFLCMLFSGFASCRMLFSSVAGIPWPLPTKKKREITRCYDRAFHSCRAVTQLQTEVSFNLNVRFLIVFVFCHLIFWFWFSPWSSPKDLTSIICSSIARKCAKKCKRVELANYKRFTANIVNLQKMLQNEYLLCSLANSASIQTRRGFGKVKKPAPLKRPRWWYVTGTDWVSSSYTAVLTPGLTISLRVHT